MAYVTVPAFGSPWAPPPVGPKEGRPPAPSPAPSPKGLPGIRIPIRPRGAPRGRFGDWKSSISDALKSVGLGPSAPAPAAIGQSPGIFDPGGFVQQNQTVLLLGAAALVAVLVLRRLKP
jgi:hypothetical protein